MDPQRLTQMANQIAGFFGSYGEAEAVAATEDHIRQFWDPRMRDGLIAHTKAGGEGLSDIARAAVLRLLDRDALAQTHCHS